MSRFPKLSVLGGLLSRPFSRRPRPDAPAGGALPPSRVWNKAQEDSAFDSPASVERTRYAAENGDPAAQNSFGLRFAFGEGVFRSEADARKWLNRAAVQGYAEAQFHLGNLCYSISLKDPAVINEAARIEAYVWLHLAASQGHVRAEAACEMLNLRLTDAELIEGNTRAKHFQSKSEQPSPARA